MPFLCLELQENRTPLLLPRKLENQPAVLPGAVRFGEAAWRVALVEMDVVNSATWLEAEIAIRLFLRSPGVSEGVNHGVLVGHRALHEGVEFLVEIIVGAGGGQRQGLEFRRLGDVAADEIEGEPSGFARDFMEPFGEFS